MEEKIITKWRNTIAAIKDGKAVKVKRDTVVIGVAKPFGTLERHQDMITFTPAKGVPAQKATMSDEKAPQFLTDLELMLSFRV